MKRVRGEDILSGREEPSAISELTPSDYIPHPYAMSQIDVYTEPAPKPDGVPLRIYSNPICPFAQVRMICIPPWPNLAGQTTSVGLVRGALHYSDAQMLKKLVDMYMQVQNIQPYD